MVCIHLCRAGAVLEGARHAPAVRVSRDPGGSGHLSPVRAGPGADTAPLGLLAPGLSSRAVGGCWTAVPGPAELSCWPGLNPKPKQGLSCGVEGTFAPLIPPTLAWIPAESAGPPHPGASLPPAWPAPATSAPRSCVRVLRPQALGTAVFLPSLGLLPPLSGLTLPAQLGSGRGWGKRWAGSPGHPAVLCGPGAPRPSLGTAPQASFPGRGPGPEPAWGPGSPPAGSGQAGASVWDVVGPPVP